MTNVTAKQDASVHSHGHLDDFEERIMFGDLARLLSEFADDRTVSEELVYGVESLKYFREFYQARRESLSPADRAKLASYDAAWCLELLDLAQRERAGRHYRA